jgi:hypothetical protein
MARASDFCSLTGLSVSGLAHATQMSPLSIVDTKSTSGDPRVCWLKLICETLALFSLKSGFFPSAQASRTVADLVLGLAMNVTTPPPGASHGGAGPPDELIFAGPAAPTTREPDPEIHSLRSGPSVSSRSSAPGSRLSALSNSAPPSCAPWTSPHPRPPRSIRSNPPADNIASAPGAPGWYGSSRPRARTGAAIRIVTDCACISVRATVTLHNGMNGEHNGTNGDASTTKMITATDVASQRSVAMFRTMRSSDAGSPDMRDVFRGMSIASRSQTGSRAPAPVRRRFSCTACQR